jgi:phage tail protein X
MASRYERNEIQKLKDGREVYRTRIYPNIPLKDNDIYIVTQTGDRLDTLSYQYYGDQSLWWIIASANNIHDASFAVEDGTILRIPKDYLQIINNFR